MSDPHVLRDGDLPTPFTAEEIRRASPAGHTVDTVTRGQDGVVERARTIYVTVDATGAIMLDASFDASGEPAGESEERAATWVDLQGHASFPATIATRTREAISHPLGELECWRYDVELPGGRRRFYFADAIPGMPVRFGRLAEDGATWATLTEVVAVTDPSPAG